MLWWSGDFPGYTAIREMLEASDAMVAFAGPLWLSGTNTAVQTTLADGTAGLDEKLGPRATPIPVLVYPVVPRNQWPGFWQMHIGRCPCHHLLPIDPRAARAEVKAAISAA